MLMYIVYQNEIQIRRKADRSTTQGNIGVARQRQFDWGGPEGPKMEKCDVSLLTFFVDVITMASLK